MAAIHVAALLSHPAVRSAIERALAARGVHGDTAIVHVDPREQAMLRFMGGVGTINPRTGLRQFFVGGSPGSDPQGGTGPGMAAGGDTQTGAQASAGGGFGGYGQADRGAGGSGLGAGGGHSGQNYYSQNMYNTGRSTPGPAQAPSYAAPAPINNMPAAAPVSLTPMMSSTATTDLASSRFGALPSWATQPYQVGMAPSSYPTPGVNAALGAPGAGGGGLPGGGGEWGAGGAANLGGGGGAPGGGGGIGPSIGNPIMTPSGSIPNPLVQTPSGLGVQLPGGTVALLNQNGPPAIGGGSINTPTLPNGQTLSQYLTSLKLGLQPKMPGAPTGGAPAATPAPQAAPQTVAQASPQIVQQVQQQVATGQLHPVVAQAILSQPANRVVTPIRPATMTAIRPTTALLGSGSPRNR